MEDEGLCTEFLDTIYPIMCFTCGENIASRVDEFEKLKEIYSTCDALDKMKIKHECSRQFFITGSSKVIVKFQCDLCLRGRPCSVHKVWCAPEQLASVELTGDGSLEELHIPLSERRAKPITSDSLIRVAKIINPPTQFGIPTSLSEYANVVNEKVLETKHKVKIMVGQVYKITL